MAISFKDLRWTPAYDGNTVDFKRFKSNLIDLYGTYSNGLYGRANNRVELSDMNNVKIIFLKPIQQSGTNTINGLAKKYINFTYTYRLHPDGFGYTLDSPISDCQGVNIKVLTSAHQRLEAGNNNYMYNAVVVYPNVVYKKSNIKYSTNCIFSYIVESNVLKTTVQFGKNYRNSHNELMSIILNGFNKVAYSTSYSTKNYQDSNLSSFVDIIGDYNFNNIYSEYYGANIIAQQQSLFLITINNNYDDINEASLINNMKAYFPRKLLSCISNVKVRA